MWEFGNQQRGEILDRMSQRPLDVLVVGGGITGAGVALDAALRGLRVGLVERDDFACGTSSRSSKMVHGGLRYLATGDIRLVREALRERRSIQQRAAHLVRPLPMLLPVHGMRVPWQRMKLGTGLWAYDLLGAWRAGVRHTWLEPDDVTRMIPNLSTSKLLGGLGYQDSQADDVRLVLAVLRTAVRHGAMCVNGAMVDHLLDVNGTVCGARVSSDVADGGAIDVRARVVINATGVWADSLYSGIGHSPGFSLLPSKGIHLTVRRDKIGVDSGVAFFSQTGNSNVFVEPWGEDLAFIGTTDAPYSGELANPEATEEEIGWMLDSVNEFLRVPVVRADVLATWAGLRPLVLEDDTVTIASGSKDVSRKHRTVISPGLVSMVGGKLTTYRQMAEDAVDAAVRQMDRTVAPCTTHRVPLEGSDLVTTSASIDELSGALDVTRRTARHLLRRYGSQTETIERMCRANPELAEHIHPDRPYIAAEVAYAGTYEMARDVEDVLVRRTRLAIETSDGGEAARGVVQRTLAAALDGSLAR